jgi:hypothetical protein
MAKRKNRRMFTREQRRENRLQQEAARRALARRDADALQRTVDGALLRAHGLEYMKDNPVEICRTWTGIKDNLDPDPSDQELLDALARQFRRATGKTLTYKGAWAMIDADEDRRDAEMEIADIERGEPDF